MPDQPPIFSLLFFRGSGIPALLVRWGCWNKLEEPFSAVPGHAAVRIGKIVYQAVSTGVEAVRYDSVCNRSDLIREVRMPARSLKQIAAAREYADRCVGEAYSWHDISITVFKWAAPWIAAKFPDLLRQSRRRTICSLFAMLVVAHGGCRLRPGTSPATTPDELMDRALDFAYAICGANADTPAETAKGQLHL